MLRVPRDPKRNLRWRKLLLTRCHKDRALRSGVMKACAEDLLFFVNTFVFSYNPHNKQKVWPFCTFDYQDKALLRLNEIIDKGEDEPLDVVCLKSRTMGASWIFSILIVWRWMFKNREKFLFISRNEDAVRDAADADSLFWKIDYILKNLPRWMLAEEGIGYNKRKDSFEHLGTGSQITGTATTDAAGVGGRATAIFIDEFSRIKNAYDLLNGTADTAPVRLFNFTIYGDNNAAHELANRPSTEKIEMHWSMHPYYGKGLYRYNADTRKIEVLDKGYKYDEGFQFVKDPMFTKWGGVRSPWYDRQCTRRANPREIAMNLDMDWQGSQYQFFDSGTIKAYAAEYVRNPYIQGDLVYDAAQAKPLRFEKSTKGPIKLWMYLDAGGKPAPDEYICGADVSAGRGASDSVVSIGTAKTAEKVLEFATRHMSADEFAIKALAICRWFADEFGNGAKMIWEKVGPGVTFGDVIVKRMGYRNIFLQKTEYSVFEKTSDQYGWMPTIKSKGALLTDYRSALANRRFINRSETALLECLSFIHLPNGSIMHSATQAAKSGDPTSGEVNHGDHVIADALVWKLCKGRAEAEEKKIEELPYNSIAWRRNMNKDRAKAEVWA